MPPTCVARSAQKLSSPDEALFNAAHLLCEVGAEIKLAGCGRILERVAEVVEKRNHLRDSVIKAKVRVLHVDRSFVADDVARVVGKHLAFRDFQDLVCRVDDAHYETRRIGEKSTDVLADVSSRKHALRKLALYRREYSASAAMPPLAASNEPIEETRQLRHRKLAAQGVGRYVLEVMRLVEHETPVGRENGGVAASRFREDERVVDDDKIRFRRAAFFRAR